MVFELQCTNFSPSIVRLPKVTQSGCSTGGLAPFNIFACVSRSVSTLCFTILVQGVLEFIVQLLLWRPKSKILISSGVGLFVSVTFYERIWAFYFILVVLKLCMFRTGFSTVQRTLKLQFLEQPSKSWVNCICCNVITMNWQRSQEKL